MAILFEFRVSKSSLFHSDFVDEKKNFENVVIWIPCNLEHAPCILYGKKYLI